MTLAELREYTRSSVLRDLALPTAWSDVELNTWINDAQSHIARATNLFLDETALTTTRDVRTYTLPARTIIVRGVEGPFGSPLMKASANTRFEQLGLPRAWFQFSPKTISFAPIPDTTYSLVLLTARLPARLESDFDEPELPEQYQLSLCDWVGLRALSNLDNLSDAKELAGFLDRRWGDAVTRIKRETYQQQFGG